jgi:hypothetical protein
LGRFEIEVDEEKGGGCENNQRWPFGRDEKINVFRPRSLLATDSSAYFFDYFGFRRKKSNEGGERPEKIVLPGNGRGEKNGGNKERKGGEIVFDFARSDESYKPNECRKHEVEYQSDGLTKKADRKGGQRSVVVISRVMSGHICDGLEKGIDQWGLE